MGTSSAGMPSGMPGMSSGDSSSASSNGAGQGSSLTPQQTQAIAMLLQNLGKQPQTVNGMQQVSPSQNMLAQVQTPTAGQFVNTASRPNGQ